MNQPVLLLAAAEQDLEALVDFYESQSRGLGILLLRDVDAVFDQLQRYPESFAVYADVVRRAPAHRFPCGIYYRVLADQVQVAAIYHDSTQPRTIRIRLG